MLTITTQKQFIIIRGDVNAAYVTIFGNLRDTYLMTSAARPYEPPSLAVRVLLQQLVVPPLCEPPHVHDLDWPPKGGQGDRQKGLADHGLLRLYVSLWV